MGYRNAKHLISNTTCHKQSFQHRCARCNLLRQRGTHQQITQISDKTHCHHFHISGAQCHKRIYTILSCRSTRKETCYKSLYSRQSSSLGYYAERESHSEISQCYGYAVTQTTQCLASSASRTRLAYRTVISRQSFLHLFFLEALCAAAELVSGALKFSTS